MKSGLIVYLAGGAELPQEFDLKGDCRKRGLNADRVEAVGSTQGFFSVDEAWHYLLTKGCGNIKLLVATAEGNCLRWVHPPVRLNG